MKRYFMIIASDCDFTIEFDYNNDSWKNNRHIEELMFLNGYDFEDKDRYDFLLLNKLARQILVFRKHNVCEIDCLKYAFELDECISTLDGSNGVQLLSFNKFPNFHNESGDNDDMYFTLEEVSEPVLHKIFIDKSN